MFWPTSTLPVYTVTLPFSPICSQASISLGRESPRRWVARPDSWATAAYFRTENTQNAGTQEAEKVTTIQIESGTERRPRKFVALGLPRSRDACSLAHCPRSFPDAGFAVIVRRLLNRTDDARVGSTAANVAVHEVDDLVLRGMVIAIEQRNRRHDHSRSAVAALHRACFEKCLLHGMELLMSQGLQWW